MAFKGEQLMNNTKLNFINDDDGIFLQIIQDGTDYYFEIMAEPEAFDYISNNAYKMELEDYGYGPVKLNTGLVCVYVGEHTEFFMSYKDNQLLSEWGISDEADKLMETELEKLCKANKIAA